jgi:prepilin signal peptidase PulO-like enzyme (type II secretory pathway)
MMSLLVGIFVADFFLGIIPDVFVATGVVGALLYNLLFRQNLFLEFLLAGFGSFLFFLVLYLLTKTKGIGFGDVKLAFLIGIALGPLGAFYALWFAFVSGAFVSVFFILLRRKKIGDTIPLGPFLVLGVFLMMFYDREITNWFCKALSLCP